MDVERDFTSSPYASAVFGAFALYLALDVPGETRLEDILVKSQVSDSLRHIVDDRLGNHWDKYLPLLTAFSKEELADFLSDVDGERLSGGKGVFSSSLPIADLVARILDLQPGDSVCDLGCATGDFIRKAYFQTFTDADDNELVGIEHSPDAAAIAEIRMLCVDAKVSIRNESMFQDTLRNARFDKVFCDPPLAARRLAQDPEVREFVQKAFPDFPELSQNMCGEWLFAACAVAAMKKGGGRAVVVMAPSALSDRLHMRYRRYFVQHGLVEAVVELPQRLFSHTNIGPSLVVFSEGNEKVRMVRAEELCFSNRKSNVLGKGHVDTIAACLGLAATFDPKGLERYCKTVARDALLGDDCDLSVRRRFAPPVSVRNGIPLGSLLENSRRGATIPAAKLDKLTTSEDTPFLYITTGYLAGGDVRPQNLREIPEEYRQDCARNGDIVISRVQSDGADIKSAVVEIPEGKSILPNGNLQVLSVDPSRADPYFIKSCLDSEYAQKFLANVMGGSVIRHITPRDLERLPIPDLPLARQREIGEICHSTIQRISRLRKELTAESDRLVRLLVDNEPDCLVKTESEA